MIAATIMSGTLSGGGPAPSAPVAAFSMSDTTGFVGFPLNLTDLSTNTPTEWEWYVNGLLIATTQNATFVPTSSDSYEIFLVARNAFGADTSSPQYYFVY